MPKQNLSKMLTSRVMFHCLLLLVLTVFETRPEAATTFDDREVMYPVSFGSTRRFMRFRETPAPRPPSQTKKLKSPLAGPRPPSFLSESFPSYIPQGTDIPRMNFHGGQSHGNKTKKGAGKPRKRVRNKNTSSKSQSKSKTPVDRADEDEDTFTLRDFLSYMPSQQMARAEENGESFSLDNILDYMPSPIRSLLQSEPEEEEGETEIASHGPRPEITRFMPQSLRSALEYENDLADFASIPTWHRPESVASEFGQPHSFSNFGSEPSFQRPSPFHPMQREVSYPSPFSFNPTEREISYTRPSLFHPRERESLYSSPHSFYPSKKEVSFMRPSPYTSEGGMVSFSSSSPFSPIEREISHSSLMNYPSVHDEVSFSQPPSFPPSTSELTFSSSHPFTPEIPYSTKHSFAPIEREILRPSLKSFPPVRKEITYSSYPTHAPIRREVSYSSPFSSPQREISRPIYVNSEYSFGHDVRPDIPRSYDKLYGSTSEYYSPRYTMTKPLSKGYTTLPKTPIYSPVMRSSRVSQENPNKIPPQYDSIPKMYKSSTNKRETDFHEQPYALRFITPPPVHGEPRYVSHPPGTFMGHHMKSFGNSSTIVFPNSPHQPSSHRPIHPSPSVPTHPSPHHPPVHHPPQPGSHLPTHPSSHHPSQPGSHSPTHPSSIPSSHSPMQPVPQLPPPPPSSHPQPHSPSHPPPQSAPHQPPRPSFIPPSHIPPHLDRATSETIRTPDHQSSIMFPGASPDTIVTDDGFNISAATGNGVCDLKNGQTMYAGTCSLLLSQSTCLENHWLVLLQSGVPSCSYRRCPIGMLFYDGSCVDPGDETVCGEGQMLYVHLTGEAECDCDPKHVYDPSSDSCYGEHEQGFCRDSFYIEFRDNKAACVANPCHQEGFVMHDGRCYQKEYDGVCPGPQIMFHPETGTAECMEIATKSIFGVRIQTACPTGSKRSFLRTCRSVFRMPSQRTFPRQRGVCPTSFTAGSRNSCRKTVGLFG